MVLMRIWMNNIIVDWWTSHCQTGELAGTGGWGGTSGRSSGRARPPPASVWSTSRPGCRLTAGQSGAARPTSPPSEYALQRSTTSGWSREWRVESRPLQTSLAVREKNGTTGLSGCKIFISTDICTRTLPSGGEDVEAHLQEDGDHDQ